MKPSLVLFALIASLPSFAAMDEAAIAKGVKTHDRALHITDGWIRDPYICRAPDGYYYLTGTTPLPDDKRQVADKYNPGIGKNSIVGYKVCVWRSEDLVRWESLGEPFSPEDGIWYSQNPVHFSKSDRTTWKLWAPELHFFDGRWFIVHTSPSPAVGTNLSLTKGKKLEAPFENPMGVKIKARHDPSLFRDIDGRIWLIWNAANVAPLKADFSDFAETEVAIGPSDRKIGHEGCSIVKVGAKYVLYGTGWSTDKLRKGTYNLYYCTADKITGPYGLRKFAGRFLGHGTLFQDKHGKWWCTAFFNANVPPLTREQARAMPLGDNAYTINEQGVTIVPMELRILDGGDVSIRAKDPAYTAPGNEEIEKFMSQ